MDKAHNPLFVGIPHPFHKQRPALVNPHLCGEAALLCRQRQADGMTAAVTRGHENGGGLSPYLDFLKRAGDIIGIQATHGHHQGRGPAGERRGLGYPGNHPAVVARLQAMDTLLHAQGVAVVLVVILVQTKLLVTQFPVQIDRSGVITCDFQAHIQGAAVPGHLLGPPDQLRGNPPSPPGRVHRQRVQARQPGTTAQDHQDISQQHTALLPRQEHAAAVPDPAFETAPAESVSRKGERLQPQQLLDVAGDNPAYFSHGVLILKRGNISREAIDYQRPL